MGEQVAIAHQNGRGDGQHHQRIPNCGGDPPGGQAEDQEEQCGEGDRDAELDTEGMGLAGQHVRRGGDEQEEGRPGLLAGDEARELQHVPPAEGVGGLDIEHRLPGGAVRQRVAVGNLGEHGHQAQGHGGRHAESHDSRPRHPAGLGSDADSRKLGRARKGRARRWGTSRGHKRRSAARP